MGKYFGTDGFRGEAGIDLTATMPTRLVAFWLVLQYAPRAQWQQRACTHCNRQRHPPQLLYVRVQSGRRPDCFRRGRYLLHVTTTPSVAYIARVDDFDCGIMISASHNPYYDNGIKLIDCYGEKMPEETLLLVEDYIDGKLHVFDKDWPELPFAHREHIGCTVDYVAGRNRYMGYLISLGIYSFKALRSVWTAPTVQAGILLSLFLMLWVRIPTSSTTSRTA